MGLHLFILGFLLRNRSRWRSLRSLRKTKTLILNGMDDDCILIEERAGRLVRVRCSSSHHKLDEEMGLFTLDSHPGILFTSWDYER